MSSDSTGNDIYPFYTETHDSYIQNTAVSSTTFIDYEVFNFTADGGNYWVHAFWTWDANVPTEVRIQLDNGTGFSDVDAKNFKRNTTFAGLSQQGYNGGFVVKMINSGDRSVRLQFKSNNPSHDAVIYECGITIKRVRF